MMKRNSLAGLTGLAGLAGLVLLLMGCEKPAEEPARDEQLVLSASTDSVDCIPSMGEQTILDLTWTAGTNHGTGSGIDYTLEMDFADNNFASAVQFQIGRTADRTLSFTHKHLSDTLQMFFPTMQDEIIYTFALRIRAKVLMTGEEQVSNVVNIKIGRFPYAVTNLYLVGDATTNGWDRDRATYMLTDPTSPNVFTWEGLLRQGEFKMIISTKSWEPAFVRDTTDATKMVYRKKEADYPDYKWTISSVGNYKIVADVKALTLSVTSLGGELYNHIYMIGDATPGGWSWDYVTELDHPQENIFMYNGPLNAGEIKFPTEIKSDWSGEMLYAPTASCAPSESGTFNAHKGSPDNKWVIPSSGTWSISIDIKNTTISFRKL